MFAFEGLWSRRKREGEGLTRRRAQRWLPWVWACASACAGHEQGEKTEIRGSDCVTCHSDEKPTDGATVPPHDVAGFSEECGTCHDQEKWRPAPRFVHTETFPLTEKHAEPPCMACHTQSYAPGQTPNLCVACHGARAAAVVDPPHQGLLAGDCFACHRTTGFFPSTFVHAWPLQGVHMLTSCSSCHGNPPQYEGRASECIACHAEDRARADQAFPGHETYPAACEACHSFESFAM